VDEWSVSGTGGGANALLKNQAKMWMMGEDEESDGKKPARLQTLLDIVNHYCAVQITLLLEQIAVFRRTLTGMKKTYGSGAIPSSEQIAKFSGLVGTASDCCFAVGFTDALNRILRTNIPKPDSKEKLDVSTVIAALNVIHESMYEEMSKRHFLVVAPDRVAKSQVEGK